MPLPLALPLILEALQQAVALQNKGLLLRKRDATSCKSLTGDFHVYHMERGFHEETLPWSALHWWKMC